ncbi:MAG: hypothetical protein KGI97_05660, partial [Alphaproteobacteria bacterium]|nr:hypothetical protein [Alphaproteobacteria bacterium]
MPIVTRTRGAATAELFSQTLFASPQPAGRKITMGFTYLQRIGKAATYDTWFPDELRRMIEAKRAKGWNIGAEDFPAEWAAIRQFELLHESGNHKIYDLEPERLERATLDLSRSMRAGGYRITVATVGYYNPKGGDELEILDQNLQERLAQMIHMLYLDEASAEANLSHMTALAARKWDYRQALPHVGMVLGAQSLFDRAANDDEGEETATRRKTKKGSGDKAIALHRAQKFFEILSELP